MTNKFKQILEPMSELFGKVLTICAIVYKNVCEWL